MSSPKVAAKQPVQVNLEKGEYYWCACGHSKSQPFCDGSHAGTHILLNNNQLGKISKEQRAGEWEVWQTGLQNPNFAEYAKLCGGMGSRVTNGSQLESAIQEALAFEGPALVEVITVAELI